MPSSAAGRRRSAGMSRAARTSACGHTVIAYNSCRNRHCPKCQGAAAREWLEEREAELLPVPVLPRRLHVAGADRRSRLHQQGRRSTTSCSRRRPRRRSRSPPIPKRLGARIGITSVLHTWGSAMTHHPHVHMIVPGGGLSDDGTSWIACRPKFFLPVRVLSRLFRRLVHRDAGCRASTPASSSSSVHMPRSPMPTAFAAFLAPLRRSRMGRLRQEAVRRAGGRARLSVALHAPRRHLEPPPDRRRRQRPSRSSTRTIASTAPARFKTMTLATARVHPTLPDPRAAQRLPSHPPLRAAGERQPRRQRRQGA